MASDPRAALRSIVVGTAGHIDHGKSALVRALTGTDPDRLKEEKERGITIDLGFAHAELQPGLVVSFVDVPGHERFVRNMLAGAHGLDAVVLVVAGDESVMPQTREHFHICRLLGVPRGVVALTKCDLADAETRAIAELEVRELVAGSFLDGAEVVATSTRTGEGLDTLRAALGRLAAASAPRADQGPPRLPVDRAFVLKGFGTVVTGTLVSGRLRVGDEVRLLPSRREARIRGLQVHGVAAPEVVAGHRTAANLAGVEVGEVGRGDVVTTPGGFEPTSMVDVALTLLPDARGLRDQARLRVHAQSAEVLGRVRLLEAPRLEPGGTALAQLRLERPIVASRGDRLVLRSYSPAVTIAGARVIDAQPPKRRARDRAAVAVLAELLDEPAVEYAACLVAQAGPRGVRLASLAARTGTTREVLGAELARHPGLRAVGASGEAAYLAEDGIVALERRALRVLGEYHERESLRPAMPREELRRRVFGRAVEGAFDVALSRLSESGAVRVVSDGVALAGHTVALSEDDRAVTDRLIEAALQAGLEGLDAGRPPAGVDAQAAGRLVPMLLRDGTLQRVGSALLVHRDCLEKLKSDVRNKWRTGDTVDVGEVKSLTGLSRKFVIPLLEYLDRERVTRRSGPVRTLVRGAGSGGDRA